mgnify:FL=1
MNKTTNKDHIKKDNENIGKNDCIALGFPRKVSEVDYGSKDKEQT